MNRNWAIIGLTCLSFSLIEKWRRSRCVWGKTHQINPRFPFSFVSASKHEEASNSDLFHFFQYSFPFALSFSLLLLLLATSFLYMTNFFCIRIRTLSLYATRSIYKPYLRSTIFFIYPNRTLFRPFLHTSFKPLPSSFSFRTDHTMATSNAKSVHDFTVKVSFLFLFCICM